MPFLPKLHSSSSASTGALSPQKSSSSSHNLTTGASHHHASTNSNNNPFELSIDVESPPIVLYGPPTDSSGSLISGQLNIDITKETLAKASSSHQKLPLKKQYSSNAITNTLNSTLSNLNLSPTPSTTVSPTQSNSNSLTNIAGLVNTKDHVLINSVQLSLVQKITYAKPFLPPSNTLAGCSSCKKKSTELARWDIMTQPYSLPLGKHSYPFSHLLPGSIPASTTIGSNCLTSLKYELIAITSYNTSNNHKALVKITLPLNVSRSILRGPDRNSLRVFPPTDVTATAVLPNVIYPRSTFALELKLDGVASENRRWRMRRVGWRIEEIAKIKANSCINHKTKLKVVEDHIHKNHVTNKPTPIKRNQQSGPTTSLTVSNASNPSPAILPTQSNPQVTTSATNESLHPSNSNDQIDNLTNPNLHPSDHANNEIRQQQSQQQDEAKKEDLALYSEETRTVASGDLRNGWKSDFSGKGKIELISDISCLNLATAAGPHITHVSSNENLDLKHHHSNVSCDIDDPVLGISVGHILIVEVVVAEEVLQASNSLSSTTSHNDNIKKADQRLAELSPIFANHIKPTQTEPVTPTLTSSSAKSDNTSSAIVGVPTGAARVLRMQFKLIVTERSGLGIAWDDEVPPTYGDVSALSPPTYDTAVVQGVSGNESSTNPPLYPLGFVPAHTHTHVNGTPNSTASGMSTPGVIYGIGNTPSITPRPSGQYTSIQGTLNLDELNLS